MQEHDLVLNLHGEMISTPPSAFTEGGEVESDRGANEAVTVLNAEPKFLPQLFKLHEAFPRLRIILEHVSTREGVEAVKKCGPTVSPFVLEIERTIDRRLLAYAPWLLIISFSNLSKNR